MEDRDRAWAEIDLTALVSNYRWLKARAADRRVIGVVKANAYGHGAVPVAKALSAAGCDAFAVVTLAEARELRQAGIGEPIHLLDGLLGPDEAEEAVSAGIVPVISRIDALDALDTAAERTGGPARFQLKVDTGMGRLGLSPRQIGAFVERLRASPKLEMEGVMSHLAEADDRNSDATAEQRRLFTRVVTELRGAGLNPEWVHLDNSAAIVRGPTPGTNAVRPGLSLYGADPTLEGGHALEPVMTLCARVRQTKSVPPGAKVGYGGDFMAKRPTCILTIPIGYADGLPRAAGGVFSAGFRGQRIPLVGRVSCDFSTLDAGPAEASGMGEEVLIFGKRNDLTIPVEELAEAVSTISYEILVRIGPRIPRVLV